MASPPRRKREHTPESIVLSSVLSFLQAYGYLSFRMNTGAARIGGRMIRFGTPGMADILAFINGKVLWIECKSPDGRQSYEQKMFEQVVVGYGLHYILARSMDDVQAWIEANP